MKLSVIHEMNRRDFLKATGKAAAAASMPSSIVGKALDIASSAQVPSFKDADYESVLRCLQVRTADYAFKEHGITQKDFNGYLTHLASTDPRKLLIWMTADDPGMTDDASGGLYMQLVNKIVSNWTPKQLFDFVYDVYGNISDNSLCSLGSFCHYVPSLGKLIPPSLIERARDVPEIAANLYKRFSNMDDKSIREYVKERRRDKMMDAERSKRRRKEREDKEFDDLAMQRWADDGGRVYESKLYRAIAMILEQHTGT